ncbi:hypothetical protein HYH03_011661 [Edaphochlamys debaryana]|uniref:Ribosome-recycling factor, chloroplastic n=1 Tax=Edaphochlamys debaryana TaxID=47281 RepID=A0A835Y2G1_9CHLO|nr:hypothetical protein HYH03_011661 [Edaphochlamys debaryana]|eukprot:KAG2489859.1 hypothetical protein HYH03_011661 [Edaphochlamys debaryana]
MGGISVPDASSLVITPFDKSSLRDIERAIQEADIGINPNNDGERIRLIIPPMTQERRKELSKTVSKMAEDGKVAVRNVRKDAMKKADKVELPKDDNNSPPAPPLLAFMSGSIPCLRSVPLSFPTPQVELPKDDKKALEDDIQKLTDSYVKKVEDMAKAKTDEVMKL